MFDKLRKMIKKEVTWLDEGTPHDGMTSSNSPTGYYTPMPLAYTFFKGTTYDNTYPSIKAIANEFATIEPYAIDANGKPLKRANVIDCLYHPNANMSAADFREALAVMTMVHPKVYLLLWHRENGYVVPGGKITEENLAGFTFMEGVSELKDGAKKYYQWDGATYGTEEVIEIFSGYDPYNLGRGYAPTSSVKKWADLDDYIAAYEAGLFENDAVPSGQFLITAKSSEEFRNIVRGMQDAHRGAGKNNNVSYVHRPVDPTTGAALSAQIEWVPFSRTNKEMSLDVIFKQANDKIDSAFGVPASIRGVNENKGYASVRVDEQNFIKYAVRPFATKIYSRLNHELNRVTGGLGYAISFEITIPGVAEEEKTEAEKKLVEFNLINAGVSAGYSLDSVVDAFELSNAYKLLKNGYEKPVIVNDKPEVDEGGEVENAPSSNKSKSIPDNCTCKRHHQKAKFASETKTINEIAEVLREHMAKQIEWVIKNEVDKDVSVVEEQKREEEEAEEMSTALLAAIVACMILNGKISHEEGVKMLQENEVGTENISEYKISEETKVQYKQYLKNVATSFNEDTVMQIRRVLEQGQEMGLNKEEIATKLREILKTDEWRIQRLARTEEHRARNMASVDSMKQLMNETGVKIYKVWKTVSANPCEFCKELDGKRELITTPFLPRGGSVTGANGGTFVNNYTDVEAADLHPNCNCSLKYEIEK